MNTYKILKMLKSIGISLLVFLVMCVIVLGISLLNYITHYVFGIVFIVAWIIFITIKLYNRKDD